MQTNYNSFICNMSHMQDIKYYREKMHKKVCYQQKISKKQG